MLPALLFTHGLRPLFSQNSPDRSRQADARQLHRTQRQGAGKTGELLCVSAPWRLGVKICPGLGACL